MAMQKYLEVLRPLRRTNSLPGSFDEPPFVSEVPDVLDDLDVRRHYTSYADGMTDSIVAPVAEKDEDKPVAEEEPTGEESAVREEEGSDETPPLKVIPCDPSRSVEWFHNYRLVSDHCPPKIAEFAKELHRKLAAPVEPPKYKKLEPAPKVNLFNASRDQLFGTKVRTPTTESKSPLDVLERIWEERKDTAISVGSRKHGLFGATKKELHQMVTAVLNKVTDDPEKFREVKNELLRLPIPEAKPEQLDKIVNVFFTKAVRETHFCKFYVDLISSICIVPRGQRLTGDKTLSLEYRLRQALVKRCQTQFTADIEDERAFASKGEAAWSEEEIAISRDRRDDVCGIARFVGELFLQKIIEEPVIEYILATSAAGNDMFFCVPPVYVPMEAQVDVIITMVNTVKGAFFLDTQSGRKLLQPFLDCITYWQDHFPVSRCRFLLMSISEKLREMNAIVNPPPKVAALPPACVDNFAADPPEVKKRPQTTVGGKPLPAPRSGVRRADALSSMNSGVSTPALGSECVLEVDFMAIPTKKTVELGNVAKLMNALRLSQVTPEALATRVREEYGNPVPLLPHWFTRCLSVVREENTRKQTGPFLVALVATAEPREARALRACIMDLVVEAFVKVIEEKLHEGLPVFTFWAKLVLSDKERSVLSEEFLNSGLEYMIDASPNYVKGYLTEVGGYYKERVAAADFVSADEASAFIRYRPLLHLFLRAKDPAAVLQAVNDEGVMAVAEEAYLFVHLCTTTPNYEGDLFERVRTNPRLERDPTFAAELISAILIAELCSPNKVFLEYSIPLLQMAVDGSNRSDREAMLVAEVYAVLEYVSDTLPLSSVPRIICKLTNAEVLSEETVNRFATYFKESDPMLLTESSSLVREETGGHGGNAFPSTSGSSATSANHHHSNRSRKNNHNAHNNSNTNHRGNANHHNNNNNNKRNSNPNNNKSNPSLSLSRSVNSSVSNDFTQKGPNRQGSESQYTSYSPKSAEIAEEYRNRHREKARNAAVAEGNSKAAPGGSNTIKGKSPGYKGNSPAGGAKRNYKN